MLRRVITGLSLSSGTFLVSIIGQVLTVPIYLSHWGPQVYGEWLTLTGFVSSVALLNLGVQGYVGNGLITHYVRREIAAGTRLLQAALLLYTGLVTIAMAATVTITFWPSLRAVLKISIISSGDTRLIVAGQGVLVAYGLVGGLLMGLFRVIGMLPRQLCYGFGERVLFLGVPLGVAGLGGTPAGATLMTVLAALGFGFIGVTDACRRSPFAIGVREATPSEALRLVPPSLSFFGLSAAGPLLTTGTVMILANRVGGTAVALFSTTLVLSNMVRMVVNQATNVVWPEITAAAAAGSERLLEWHRLMQKLAGGLVLGAFLALGLIGPKVLEVWTRGTIAVDPALNLLLALYLVIHVPSLVSGTFGMATNRQRTLVPVQVAVVVTALALGWCLAAEQGVRGIALALIVSQVPGSICTVLLACRWTGDRPAAFIGEVFGRGVPVVIVVCVGMLAAAGSVSGVVGRFGVALAIGLLAAGMLWRFWLNADERRVLKVGFAGRGPTPGPGSRAARA